MAKLLVVLALQGHIPPPKSVAVRKSFATAVEVYTSEYDPPLDASLVIVPVAPFGYVQV